MSLISEGIENVRVYELPVGVWAGGAGFAAVRSALVAA